MMASEMSMLTHNDFPTHHRLEDDAIDEPLPMPPHWHAPRGPGMFRFLFVLLCIIAVGQPDLEELWEGCRHDSNAFRAQMARLTDPLTTVIVVAGLVLSSISAFVTTVTPLPGLFNYTTRGIYILFVLAFGLSLGGVVVGSAVIYVTSKVRHTWFLKTFMSSRSHVCCSLVLLSYPFLCIGLSTMLMAFGGLMSLWLSEDRHMIIAGTFVLATPLSMIPLFFWTQCGNSGDEDDSTDVRAMSDDKP